MDNRVRKLMETRLNHDSDRLELLEKQLREARELAAESDRKFEEVIAHFYKLLPIHGTTKHKCK